MMMDFKDAVRILARERENGKAGKEKEEKFPGDERAETYHVVKIDGVPLRYKATAGYIKMKDEKMKLKTRMFYIAYEKADVKDKSTRPLTFAFNGGPGAASAWVHFGAMGPKRVKTNEMGHVLPPPYRFEDNEQTWLQFTDLVFIDPVGTGFSYYDKEEDPKQFYGVEEDFKWGGDFMRQYVTENKRWLSPKYMAGESYGTFRSVGLAHYLQNQHALDFNGLIMISSALNYLTFAFSPGNDMPYILSLPSFTAAAFYHNKLAPELQKDLVKTLKKAEDWTYNEYAVALLKGARLTEKERQKIIKQYAKFTALPEKFIDDSDLRVTSNGFRKTLFHDDHMVVGLYDSRLLASDIDPAGDTVKTDPSMFNIYGSCIAALNHFLSTELKYENELPYRPLSRDVGKSWNWSSGIPGGMGYVNVIDKLSEIMSYNEYLKVFMASGYYDLCTPYFTNQYTWEHMGLHERIKENFVFECYEAGHMMYVHKHSRVKLRDDIKRFFESRKETKVLQPFA